MKKTPGWLIFAVFILLTVLILLKGLSLKQSSRLIDRIDQVTSVIKSSTPKEIGR